MHLREHVGGVAQEQPIRQIRPPFERPRRRPGKEDKPEQDGDGTRSMTHDRADARADKRHDGQVEARARDRASNSGIAEADADVARREHQLADVERRERKRFTDQQSRHRKDSGLGGKERSTTRSCE